MFDLSLQTLSILWTGAFVGALAAGGAGFAFALAAASVWLHAFDPLRTTALVVACGSVLHFTLVWPIRRSIELPRLGPFLAGAIFGIPLGVLFLTHIDGNALKIALGVFMIAYGLYALLSPRLHQIALGGRALDVGVGFLGDVLGGIGGYSGVLPTIWTQLRGWPKEVARGVYQPFILFAHVATLLLVGARALDEGGLRLFLLALPALALGAWLGLHIYGRLDDRRFRQVLAVMIVGSGLGLVV